MSILQRILRPSLSSSLWKQYGLTARGSAPAVGRYQSLSRSERFRLALEEAGGLFATFGEFLSGRADLLPGSYLAQLRAIRAGRKANNSPSSVAGLRERVFHAELIRARACSEVYSGEWEGRSVILEIYPQERWPSETAWRGLTQQLRLLRNATEGAVSRPAVLEQFREWLNLQSDIERRRRILSNLQDLPVACTSQVPPLIPELQLPRCIAYGAIEGEPLAEALRSGPRAPESLEIWAESVLEQALLLSIIDGDAMAENYALVPGGRVGLRVVPALETVPVEWHYELLQYVSAAMAGNAHRATHMLARICSPENTQAAEQKLLERLSSLQPELKAERGAQESISGLENYWRALGQSSYPAPLFLHLFHRNLVVLSQSAGAESQDVVTSAMWPVLGRILQLRMREVLSSEKGTEWLASSGLLLVNGVRQVIGTMEQLRDDDLTATMLPQAEQVERLNRRAVQGIRSAVSLVLFLVSLQLALNSTGGLQVAATLAAAALAAAVCVFVARIE